MNCNSYCTFVQMFANEAMQVTHITGYFQNVKEFKNEESKLKSIQFGTGLNKTHTAFKL